MTTKRAPQAKPADSRAGVLTLLRGTLLMLAILVLAVFAQSYTGRRQLVQSAREVCHANQRHLVVPVDNALAAIQQADEQIAQAGHGVTPVDRRIRQAEQIALERQLLAIDQYIDPTDSQMLNAPNRNEVAALDAEAFSCAHAHPEPSPVDFFG